MKTLPKDVVQKPKKKQNNQKIKREIIAIVGVAISIYLSVSIFLPGSGGFFGIILAGLLRGFFGIGAFILPFAIVSISVFSISSKQPLGKGRYIIPLIFILFISLLHIVNGDNESILYIFTNNNYYNFVSNGGAVGAMFANTVVTILGNAGAVILIFASFIVLIISLTGKSLAIFLRDTFYAIINKAEEVKERRIREYEVEELDVNFKGTSKVRANKNEKLKDNKISKETEIQDIQEEIFVIEEQRKKQIKLNFDNSENNDNIKQVKNSINTTYAKDSNFKLPWESEDVYNDKENLLNKDKDLITNIQENSVNIDNAPTINETDEKTEEQIKINNEERVNNEDFDDYYIEERVIGDYKFPDISLLSNPPQVNESLNKSIIYENSKKLEQTLKDFGVIAKVTEVSKGPTVTRYELSPGTGVKVSKISSLADDLALNLAAKGIRIEAPIPGKSAVGIEIPNDIAEAVYFRELIESSAFKSFDSSLAFAIGKDIAGSVMVTDLAKMPHLLIAGATGAGKSVCINTLVVSLLFKSPPDKVKLIMIDPKVVELSVYNGIPHLLIPVVTDPKKAAGALNWAVREMLKRYDAFATTSTRDLKSYNSTLEKEGQETLPQIVIIIDELADLMMAAPGEVEDSICRLAQMARAAGIHLVIATQRPSVDVITGLIKANVPSRLAFSVSSGTDSRTILDTVGAEKLLGRGDMLFSPIGIKKPHRIQGAFISDKEVESIVSFLKVDYEQTYDEEMVNDITSSKKTLTINEDTDEFFEDAVLFVIEKQKASTSMLQRQFRIGYQRAARLMDFLHEQGIVGPEDGAKPRKILITKTVWEDMKNNQQ